MKVYWFSQLRIKEETMLTQILSLLIQWIFTIKKEIFAKNFEEAHACLIFGLEQILLNIWGLEFLYATCCFTTISLGFWNPDLIYSEGIKELQSKNGWSFKKQRIWNREWRYIILFVHRTFFPKNEISPKKILICLVIKNLNL